MKLRAVFRFIRETNNSLLIILPGLLFSLGLAQFAMILFVFFQSPKANLLLLAIVVLNLLIFSLFIVFIIHITTAFIQPLYEIWHYSISSDTTSAKDALVLLLTRQIEPTSGKISWNAKGGAHSLISYEDHLLYKHLSIAENLSLTYPSSNRFFFSQKRNSLNARLILEKYGIFWDVNKPVYSLTELQQYILRIVKAVYLGAEYLIAMANRYALYNWRLLIIHLPNINLLRPSCFVQK